MSSEQIQKSKTHKLKTWLRYYYAIANGTKTFELRKNDRNFQVGDTLILQEYDENENEYTGRELSVVVSYVILEAKHFGLMDGYCIMGFSLLQSQSIPVIKDISNEIHFNDGMDDESIPNEQITENISMGKLNFLEKSNLEHRYEKETGKKHWTNPVSHGEYAFPTDDYVNWLMRLINILAFQHKKERKG